MADTNNRENGIQIDISYKYDSSGMKKAIADVEAVDTKTSGGIVQARKNIKTLIAASQSMAQYLSKDNEKVANALEKQAAAYSAVTKALNAYKMAQSRVKAARQNLESVKNAITTTKTGKERKNISISGSKVYRKTKNGDVIDEQATNRLVAATERLKQARTAQKNVLLSLQSSENSYRKSILATAEAQKQAELDNVKNKINAVSGALKKLTAKIKQIDIQRLVAQIYMLRRAWTLVESLVEASADWVENLNLLEVVFGDAADSAKDFVKATANNLGLDANELAQYVSTFKQMANAMGQTAETGTNLSKALTYLGLDISSLRNVDVKTAMSDLASGIAGQVKPVRKYGADITEDSINAFLREYGASTSALSQSDKQLVRALLLIRQLKDSWGDMAKTINTFSNQQRVLNSQFETFKRLLGSVLVGTFELTDENGLPTTFKKASETAGIATKAIWYLNGAIMAINEVLAAVVPNVDNVNGAIGTIGDDAQDAEDAIDGLNDSTKGSLASFDKFTTLGSGTAGGSETSAWIEQLFSKESGEYIKTVEDAMKNSAMYAKEIAQSFLKKMFPEFNKWLESNPDGTFASWAKSTGNFKDKLDGIKNSLFGLITLLVGIKSPVAAIMLAVGKTALSSEEMMDKILDVVVKLARQAAELLPKIAELAIELAPIALNLLEIVVDIADWVAKNDLLVPSIIAVIVALVALKAVEFGIHVIEIVNSISKLSSSVTKIIPRLVSLASQLNATTIAAGALGLAWGMMLGTAILSQFEGETQRVISIVFLAVGAFTALAIAVLAYKGALTMGVAVPIITAAVGIGAAGIKGLIDSANTYANGGFQKGGLFYAGENGAEWVGRQGNTSTIVNDTQMSDIMRDSVAQGVRMGVGTAYGDISNAGAGQAEAAVYLDGEKVGRYVASSSGFRREANRRNIGLNWS